MLLLSSAIGMETDTKRRLSKRASCDAESAVHETAATIKRRFMFLRNYGTSLVSSHPAFPFYIAVADVIDFFYQESLDCGYSCFHLALFIIKLTFNRHLKCLAAFLMNPVT